MLIRLKVKGFKNLANVDVSFGPFTCIAGANGVGKSNLFDAITFLSALADRPLTEAAKAIRDDRNRSTDVRSLFLKHGDEHLGEMSFEAEMLVPSTGNDDLGQTAEASITFLRYALTLSYHRDGDGSSAERLEVKSEQLDRINIGDAPSHLLFPRNTTWLKSVVHGRRAGQFLSTEGEGGDRHIKLHQDGRKGRAREVLAATLPRTVLSSTNALDSPTALLARREMQSWRLLQLEPSSLRNSDSFNAPVHIGSDGSHLAATLHHLARQEEANGNGRHRTPSVYAKVANRLSSLVENVREVKVDEDRQRELYTLQVVGQDRSLHAARALSDGTLRFLALAILEHDPGAQGLLCFEEPENGIHPERISSMLNILRDLCVNTEDAVSDENPMRQVIVNTHSPAVVGLIDDDDLLIAEPHEVIVQNDRCRAVSYRWLANTWRHKGFSEIPTVSRGSLSAYLNPFAFSDDADEESFQLASNLSRKRPRVKDRKDLNMMLGFMANE
ncbi:MAG: AAA family ATPase [Pirellulaceae bacterium]|nr:AAA family ATPase [Pirellulaceae bacterium]